MYPLTILLFLFSPSVFAQNYVVNGSFEREPAAARGPAPVCAFSGNPAIFNNYVEGWQCYFNMTPDLLILDDSTPCPDMPKPRTGRRMTGLIMYHPAMDGGGASDYHEIIQGTLARPLEPGKTYRVRFRTRTDDSLGVRHLASIYGGKQHIIPVRCGNFGFYFSRDKINGYEDFFESQAAFPIQPQINREAVLETPGGEWTQVSMLFTADQPYRYFRFGNFYYDALTPISMSDEDRSRIDSENITAAPLQQKTIRIAYYCFDDFVVEEFHGEDYAKTLREEQKLSFDAALLFDVDQAALKPSALTVLDQLAAALGQLRQTRVEIGGHTDSQGESGYNQQLSERRARAVADYLLGKGIPEAQLRWKGYGETQPAADNATDAGRQKNRRVECRVLRDE